VYPFAIRSRLHGKYCLKATGTVRAACNRLIDAAEQLLHRRFLHVFSYAMNFQLVLKSVLRQNDFDHHFRR
jgi:hypothetical protein